MSALFIIDEFYKEFFDKELAAQFILTLNFKVKTIFFFLASYPTYHEDETLPRNRKFTQLNSSLEKWSKSFLIL